MYLLRYRYTDDNAWHTASFTHHGALYNYLDQILENGKFEFEVIKE